MTEKPAIETMTNQERFNSAVMGWISEATEAIEGCGAVSDSAKRYVDEMRCECGDAYQALFCQQSSPAHFTLADEEWGAIAAAVAFCASTTAPLPRSEQIVTLRALLERTK